MWLIPDQVKVQDSQRCRDICSFEERQFILSNFFRGIYCHEIPEIIFIFIISAVLPTHKHHANICWTLYVLFHFTLQRGIILESRRPWLEFPPLPPKLAG